MWVCQCLLLITLFIKLSFGADSLYYKSIYQQYDRGLLVGQSIPLLGLQIEELVSQKKLFDAKQLLEQAQPSNDVLTEAVTWRLLQLAVLNKQYGAFLKSLRKLSKSKFLKNTDLMRQVYQDLPKRERSILVHAMIKAGFFDHKPKSPCPYFELLPRKNRAEFLFQIASEERLPHDIKEKVLYELFVLTPEAISGGAIRELSDFAAFLKKLKARDLVARMEVLLTFGQNKEARSTFDGSVAADLSFNERCELNYVDAKIDRKMKKLTLARNRFADLANDCDADIKKKSRFMDLMLASMQKDETSLPKFASFVADYPKDSFSDDVLMFKAMLLLDVGRTEDGIEALSEMITKYPDSDMIERALFLRGFYLAKLGEVKEAHVSFLRLSQIAKADSLDGNSAKYWTARLSVFNDVAKLTDPKKDKIPHAQKLLKGLIESPSPNVYSWLAYSLLETLGKPAKRTDFKLPKPVSSNGLHTKGPAPLPFIEMLVEHGFRAEAMALLDDMPITDDPKVAMACAVLFDTQNRHEAAHHKLIRCDADRAAMLAQTLPEAFRSIAYPRSFEQEVAHALLRVDVPKPLIFGIMRQESGFIAQSCSWAGARGLMQIMFPSAREAGRHWRIDNLREADLYLPHINILLGASLVQGYWQQFGHLALGLCAYNAGPQLAKGWLRKNNGAPLDTFLETISLRETQNYVKTVLSNTLFYAALDDIDSLPPLPMDLPQ